MWWVGGLYSALCASISVRGFGLRKPNGHGTSYLLFNEFHAYFNGPTSTSPQIEVCMMFTSESKGIILDLKKNDGELAANYFLMYHF